MDAKLWTELVALRAEVERLRALLLKSGWEHNPHAEIPWKPPVNLVAGKLHTENSELLAEIKLQRALLREVHASWGTDDLFDRIHAALGDE